MSLRSYVDADILIWHLRGEKSATQFLAGLRDDRSAQLWIGAMQRAEVVFFMRKSEEEDTYRLLSLFKTADVTQTVVDRGGELFRRWNKSHGVDANDALLAATAMLTGGKVYTLNLKHYPMPDLVVERAW